jgi:hypothetical protein
VIQCDNHDETVPHVVFLQDKRKKKRVECKQRVVDLLKKYYLQNFHESGDVELGVECEIMDVSDQNCNLFFQPMEAIF